MDQGNPRRLGLPGLIAGLNEEGGRVHGFFIRDVQRCTLAGFLEEVEVVVATPC